MDRFEIRSATRLAWSAVLIGVVLVVVVSIPRFATYRDLDVSQIHLTSQPNGWYMKSDDGKEIGRFSFDNYSYIASVEYFRGDFTRYPIYGPWRWRLLPSWLAAQTPIDNPAVAYAAVSLAFLIAGVVSLVAASVRNGLGRRGQTAVAVLYAVAFPTLWYGTSGYVDGPLVAMLCVALLLIQWERWWLFLLLLPLGFLVKETFLLIVPVAATYRWARSNERRDWLPFTIASIVIIGVMWFGIRWLLPTPRTLDWIPRWSRFSWNLSRPEAVGSAVLTSGVVVPLGLIMSWRLWFGRKDPAGFARWRESRTWSSVSLWASRSPSMAS